VSVEIEGFEGAFGDPAEILRTVSARDWNAAARMCMTFVDRGGLRRQMIVRLTWRRDGETRLVIQGGERIVRSGLLAHLGELLDDIAREECAARRRRALGPFGDPTEGPNWPAITAALTLIVAVLTTVAVLIDVNVI
jgi:hypothetical protein